MVILVRKYKQIFSTILDKSDKILVCIAMHVKRTKKGETLKISTGVEQVSECQQNVYGKYCKTSIKKTKGLLQV
jgi:hypothetical protein